MKHRKVNVLLAFLILAGIGPLHAVFRCERPDQISITRPFYQAASGWAGKTYAGLFAGFGKIALWPFR